MTKYVLLTALISVALVACTSSKPLTTVVSNTPNNTVTGPSRNILGLLEVRIDGMGEGLTPTASAKFVNPQGVEGGLQAKAITSYPLYTDTNLAFQRRTVAFLDTDDYLATTDPNTTGASRYITATFGITNNTTTSFNNLTLVAASVPQVPVQVGLTPTLGGTAFSTIQRGDGTLLSNAVPADVTRAQRIVPTSGVAARFNGVSPEFGMTDFQIITPTEAALVTSQAAAFSPALNVVALEYGFVARDGNSTTSRAIPNGGGTGQVTLAYKLPKVNPRSANPFGFVIYYVVTNDTSQFVSQSTVEQAALLSNASFDTFSGDVRVLEGSRLVNRDDLLPACGIMTAFVSNGSSQFPVHFNPVRGFSTFSQASFLPVLNQPDCTFGASGRRETSVTTDTVAGVANVGTNLFVVGTVGTAPNRDVMVWALTGTGKANNSFNANGKRVIDFGSDDVASGIQLDPVSGDLYLAATTGTGISRNFAVARVNQSGVMSTIFDTDGKAVYNLFGDDVAADLLVQPDGKVVVAGSSFVTTDIFISLLRVGPTGAFDTTFSGDGVASTGIGAGGSNLIATSVARNSNGKIIVAGYTNFNTSGIDSNDMFMLDLNADGSEDFTTPPQAINFGFDDRAWDVAVYPPSSPNADKILVVGQLDGGTSDFGAVRFNADGTTRDTSFGSGAFGGNGKFNATFGGAEFARAVNIDASGNIYLTGYTSVGNDFGIMRLTPAGVLDTNFDGDGKLTLDFNNTDDQAFGAVLDSNGNLVIAGNNTGTGSNFQVMRLKTGP